MFEVDHTTPSNLERSYIRVPQEYGRVMPKSKQKMVCVEAPSGSEYSTDITDGLEPWGDLTINYI